MGALNEAQPGQLAPLPAVETGLKVEVELLSVSKETGAREGRQSAIACFNSPVYYRHLQYLNLRRARPVIVNRLLGENRRGPTLQSLGRN